METVKYKTALIVGAGEGLSAALTRLFTREGIRVALAARQIDKLGALCKETGATAYICDATSLDDVTRLFASIERDCGAPDVVVYNASAACARRICGSNPRRCCESYRRQRVWWLFGRATGIAPHAP
jgi:NADP-dependent 3-hydroxy acid dehydrogenase YdfG